MLDFLSPVGLQVAPKKDAVLWWSLCGIWPSSPFNPQSRLLFLTVFTLGWQAAWNLISPAYLQSLFWFALEFIPKFNVEFTWRNLLSVSATPEKRSCIGCMLSIFVNFIFHIFSYLVKAIVMCCESYHKHKTCTAAVARWCSFLTLWLSW